MALGDVVALGDAVALGNVVTLRDVVVIWWLIGSALNFWGRGPEFESCFS